MRFFTIAGFVFVMAMVGVIGLFDSCIHGGIKYREGEHFLPNGTVIQTEGPQQCVQCRCLQGLVLCEIENCPVLQCEAPLRNPNFCCQHCSEIAKGKKKTSEFSFGRTGEEVDSKENSKKDCVSNGKNFKSGSVWQPVIGPFGVMACVQCRCHEGNVICTRPECGNVRCSQPRREFGQCCPVCSTLAESKRKAFCLPKTSEIFVFKAPNVQSNSDRIEYAFLENNKQKHDMVKIHTWNLRPKTPSDVFNISFVPEKQFHRRNFQILGSVSRRRLRKYSKREKKLMNNCHFKCFPKIKKLESSLVDHLANERYKCIEGEIDVSEICC